MTNQYHIYLAVPGRKFCWGTVTGVINSTSKHVAHPFNGGLGFSGVIDFNMLWTDALNCYEQERITHFAMLHGDLWPDEDQRWLDILLEEMETRDAELVSAHSPIKDHRGLTSSGICDPTNPWGAYRRFTQREILHELPETFNNALAGYPDRPLLHNTGCWVADLRKPVFRELREDGAVRVMFEFPERIVRGAGQLWEHQQESEDWHLSRLLWQLQARNTWITRKVRLTHCGDMTWPNWVDFGSYMHGDECTANRWRKDKHELPLAMTQMLEFELGSKCNLGHEHHECPNLHPERYSLLDTTRELTDDDIVTCAVRAYRELGFTGLVGWIYYNEPLLQAERMFRLMERIKTDVPAARFILWTNGILIPEEVEQYKQFESIIISGHNEQSLRGGERLTAGKINYRLIKEPELDNRLVQIEPANKDQACLRPFVEFVIDNYGNTHLCCYDWQGKGTFGNVLTADFGDISRRWREMLPEIVGDKLTDQAPQVCQDCGHRWMKYQCHDNSIIDRVKEYRNGIIRQQQAATKLPVAAAVDESGFVSANAS